MRIPILFLATYLAAVLQISLADVVSVGHVGPDLLAMVAMVWTLQRPSPCGFLIAGLIGLLGDLIASGHPGLGMAVYLLAGYGAARWARWTPNHVAWRVCAVWLATSQVAVLTPAAGPGRNGDSRRDAVGSRARGRRLHGGLGGACCWFLSGLASRSCPTIRQAVCEASVRHAAIALASSASVPQPRARRFRIPGGGCG